VTHEASSGWNASSTRSIYRCCEESIAGIIRRMNSVRWLVVVALVACSSPSPKISAPTVSQPAPPVETSIPRAPGLRLPAEARPTAYVLDLRIDPAAERVPGKVTIDVEITKPTQTLWLHAAPEITIDGASVDGESARVVRAGDALGLVAGKAKTGRARVVIDFSAPIDHARSRGIYAEREGNETYAYTFFEPIDARRAFPCFDEPGFKTPWTLVFHVKPEHVALGNTAVVNERIEGATKRVELAPSKPLPSYLVAFIVGPFDVIDGGTGGRANTQIRFAVPKGRAGELRWARDVTPRVVTALEDYFDMAYPFGKLDVAVVPRYWGTMEHPGIVAMGQPLTLIKPGEETRRRKLSYANILAHELAHYWFGDYVTMKWWDDTWLNESFGQWLDAIITDAVEPSWRYGEDRVGSSEWAMIDDEALATRPIRRPIEKREEIESSFDNTIVYYKGAALIRMLEAWLGKEAWRDTMRAYMAKHAWGSASADDMFAVIGARHGEQAERVARSFVEQPGVPLISFEPRCTEKKLVLRQTRALPLGLTDPTPRQWTVPVCFRYGDNEKTHGSCVVLDRPEAEITLESCPTWFVPNRDGRGYYRSAIDPKLTRVLLDSKGAAARRAKPTAPEKIMIAVDMDAAVTRGELAVTHMFSLAPLLIEDPDLKVAGRATIASAARTDSADDALWLAGRRWFVKTFGPTAQRLGWQRRATDSDELHELRIRLVSSIARLDRKSKLAADADKLVERWLEDRSGVSDDLVDGALTVAAYHGNPHRFDSYLTAAKAARDRREQQRILSALGAFRDPALAQRALDVVLGKDFDLRETASIVYRLLGQRETRDLTLDFLAKHLDTLLPRMRHDTASGFLARVAGSFCDKERRERAAELVVDRAKKLDGAEAAVTRALEQSDQCIAQLARQLPDLRAYFAK
jgi:aminopeptidase N